MVTEMFITPDPNMKMEQSRRGHMRPDIVCTSSKFFCDLTRKLEIWAIEVVGLENPLVDSISEISI